MPEYWENPSKPGTPAKPPPVEFEKWANQRGLHLSQEIERAGQELLAARASAASVSAKNDQIKAHLDAKLERASEYEGQVHAYWSALRAQAEAEFPDGLPAADKVSDEVVALADESPVEIAAPEPKRWWRR